VPTSKAFESQTLNDSTKHVAIHVELM